MALHHYYFNEVSNMISSGLFDFEFRMREIDKNGDPLVKLDKLVDWEAFRNELNTVHNRERKSAAGRKPFDPLLMLKILILQIIYFP